MLMVIPSIEKMKRKDKRKKRRKTKKKRNFLFSAWNDFLSSLRWIISSHLSGIRLNSMSSERPSLNNLHHPTYHYFLSHNLLCLLHGSYHSLKLFGLFIGLFVYLILPLEWKPVRRTLYISLPYLFPTPSSTQ